MRASQCPARLGAALTPVRALLLKPLSRTPLPPPSLSRTPLSLGAVNDYGPPKLMEALVRKTMQMKSAPLVVLVNLWVYFHCHTTRYLAQVRVVCVHGLT